MRLYYWIAFGAFGLASAALADQNPAGPFTIAGHARFTVIAPEVIRMEYSPTDQFIDNPSLFAINRNPTLTAEELQSLKVTQTSDSIVITTSRMTFKYTSDGTPFHTGNPSAIVNGLSGNQTASWSFGQKNQANLGGTTQNLDGVSGPIAIPDGVIARDGWYYLDDSSRFLIDATGAQDFESGWVKQRDPKTDSSDGYFFAYGVDYKAALRALTRVSGAVAMPRRYTLGTWYSRWWPYTSDDYREIAAEFHQHDFPLDMMVMDMDWHIAPGWTGYTWNPKLFPDGPQYLQDLHDLGLHATLNDHPQEGVKPTESMYAAFMIAMGQDPSKGQTLTYNAGDPHYINTSMEYTHTPLEKEGVDFWWLDWMGDDQSPFNQMGWMNELYFRHSETSLPEKNLRGQSFSRWADWGDQRHPIHFSGDTKILWSTLQFEVPFTATAGNVGCFYWSHDIGGFIDDTSVLNSVFQIRQGELIARWTQFGAVSPVLRLHSANRAWLDKRPWTYPSDIENSMRVSFHLRSEIFPYIYSSAWEAHSQTLPLVRPLYIEYPEVSEAYQNPQEYFFGDAMLAAPIVTEGDPLFHISTQKVWFPPGRWFDWFTGEEHTALTEATIYDDLNSFPLFARGGFPIFMQPYTERMTTGNPSQLIVRLYPGSDGQSSSATFYEDDGETKNYLNGDYALTEVQFSQSAGVMELKIIPSARSSAGDYDIQYISSAPFKSVNVNEIPWSPTYDQSARTNHILIPASPSKEPITVLMTP